MNEMIAAYMKADIVNYYDYPDPVLCCAIAARIHPSEIKGIPEISDYFDSNSSYLELLAEVSATRAMLETEEPWFWGD